ncbi:hypothetical protein CAC42_4202 [Sphaceloma murrayae]|uniref:Fucose-specific lectin n=1 Tax=Sphaceloma murrayae TaxID=2082308 RepID=A0A2K1QLJ2_9PEZI|nr:hypothetical protein CAC42_4202 [Sphaceloma murrayae]
MASDTKGPLIDPGLIPIYQPQIRSESSPQEQKIVAGDRDPSHAPEAITYAPYYSTPTSPYPSYSSPVPQPGGYDGHDTGGAPHRHRSRKRKMIILASLLLIAIAAILGGVLGTQLNKSSDGSNSADSSSTFQPPNNTSAGNDTTTASAVRVLDRTGIATAARADGQGMLLYYQSPNNSIIETFFPTSLLNTSSSTYRPSTTALLPISDIAPGSPLSAITYSVNSTLFRQLFYARSDLRIMQIHATASTSWSTPAKVSPNTDDQYLFSGSAGLCAMPFSFTADGDFFGARVYYAQKRNWVQELWWDQRRSGIDQVWTQGQVFSGADARAGTGCGVSWSGDEVYTSVWYRNGTTGGAEHSYLTNNGRNAGWVNTREITLDANEDFAPSTASAFAAVSDAASNAQYLFFEGRDGELKMVASAAAPPGPAEGSFLSFGPVEGGKLAAFYVGGSPVVANQFDSGELRLQRIARQGSVLANGTVVG